jgi:hypothetical protein
MASYETGDGYVEGVACGVEGKDVRKCGKVGGNCLLSEG